MIKYPITIKRGPLALIKNIVIVEIFVGILLVLSVYAANYEQILRLTLAKFIRYDYALVLSASLLQLFVTFIVFLRWQNENYEIREKEIIRKKGIFSVTQKSLPLKDVKEVVFKQNLFEKLTNCGTVVIRDLNSKKILSLKNIENAELIADTLKSLIDRMINVSKDGKDQKLSVLDLILGGENQNLEFKESFRWDIKRKFVNKDLEKTTMKVIASFLNLDGGRLIIGISDNKTPIGLQDDYQSLPRTDRDGFENHFNHIFNAALGAKFRQFVKLNFEEINGRDVCLVEVSPSDAPVYLKFNNAEEFYVRTGNATTALMMSEAADYIKSHWREN
ncbi:MAG: putative DNA binding domain-containing protein [Candidatus Pacebacteria bacterium]|nr:putative DNA binding domain-containing protein [Candidatus Paceibacterota bacterium]